MADDADEVGLKTATNEHLVLQLGTIVWGPLLWTANLTDCKYVLAGSECATPLAGGDSVTAAVTSAVLVDISIQIRASPPWGMRRQTCQNAVKSRQNVL